MISIERPNVEFNKSKFEEFCRYDNISIEDSYLNFLQEYNGGHPESNSYNFTEDVEVEYEFAITCFFGTEVESYMNIFEIFNLMRDRIPRGLLPIARDEGGNLICLNIEPHSESFGYIYLWDHDSELLEDGIIPKLSFVAKCFEDFLSNIIVDDEDMDLANYEIESVWIDPDFLKEIN